MSSSFCCGLNEWAITQDDVGSEDNRGHQNTCECDP